MLFHSRISLINRVSTTTISTRKSSTLLTTTKNLLRHRHHHHYYYYSNNSHNIRNNSTQTSTRQQRQRLQPPPSTTSSNSTTTTMIMMDKASSYINNLRLKIATSLTSSMNEKDRQQFLSSLPGDVGDGVGIGIGLKDNNVKKVQENNKDNNDVHENKDSSSSSTTTSTTTLSIGEAISNAMVEEASSKVKNSSSSTNTTQSTMTEEEKNKIFQQAEKAAMERMQNDLLIQERRIKLIQWEKELEEEKMMEEEKKNKMMMKEEGSKLVLQDENNDHEEEKKVEEKISHSKEFDHHPILGQVIADFGYKRLHIMSTKKLAAVPIWEKQRVYRHDRAKIMAKDKLKSMDIGLPGVVALHETLDGELSIIDGQHRVGMLAILESEKNKANKNNTETTTNNNNHLNLDQILVEVFPQYPSSSSTHAQDIFIEINKAEPVKLVDMPGVASNLDRRIISDAAMHLQDVYSEMFKPSQRCRSPHLNVDNLRDAIFAAEVLKKGQIKSKTALVKWMLQKNEEMKVKYNSTSGNKEDTNKAALEKAKKFDFYLGMDLTWLHQTT